ncbi:MAG: hypothetical protein IJ757_04210 [Clostridiales bacterium]|nr:hypothetical protein [Clostridiales bacterium]
MQKELVFRPEQIGNVDDIKGFLARKAGVPVERLRITKAFVDARRKPDVKFCYRVTDDPETDYTSSALKYKGRVFKSYSRPVVIGFGPAGMFAGLVLSHYGLNPIIIEKGKDVARRTEDVNRYKQGGRIDPSSNIQFGEGGAGTFSDGKLYTGVTNSYQGFISQTFVKHGAPSDIMYESHPHVGTDNLVNVVKGIREEIIRLGGEVHFEEEFIKFNLNQYYRPGKIEGITTPKGYYETDTVILAIGNSSRDLIRKYVKWGITSKPFAIGVRIEHLRSDIDIAMYGFDTSIYKNIFAANYKLAVDTSTGNKLYTFCMCPGGEVVPSASYEGAICTNGMSYRNRDNINSNSALLIPFDPKKVSDDPLVGLTYQDMLETSAYKLAGKTGYAPYMTYGDLKNHRSGTKSDHINPSYSPGAIPCDLRELLPGYMTDTLTEGIALMGRKIKGFDSDSAVLTAVETRSSSPVRILRDEESFESIEIKGLFPIGEGAGYAGGIMSSAIDGIKCANRLVESMLI